jgi:hypothetical protein
VKDTYISKEEVSRSKQAKMVPIPQGAAREDIAFRLSALLHAIEAHPANNNNSITTVPTDSTDSSPPTSQQQQQQQQQQPPQPHPGLFQLWDFVKRSHYIMTELDNILEGKPVLHPDQVPPADMAKDNEERARMAFTDVLTRTITINKIVNQPGLMSIPGQEMIDFGDEIKLKSQAVQDAILNLPE